MPANQFKLMTKLVDSVYSRNDAGKSNQVNVNVNVNSAMQCSVLYSTVLHCTVLCLSCLDWFCSCLLRRISCIVYRVSCMKFSLNAISGNSIVWFDTICILFGLNFVTQLLIWFDLIWFDLMSSIAFAFRFIACYSLICSVLSSSDWFCRFVSSSLCRVQSVSCPVYEDSVSSFILSIEDDCMTLRYVSSTLLYCQVTFKWIFLATQMYVLVCVSSRHLYHVQRFRFHPMMQMWMRIWMRMQIMYVCVSSRLLYQSAISYHVQVACTMHHEHVWCVQAVRYRTIIRQRSHFVLSCFVLHYCIPHSWSRIVSNRIISYRLRLCLSPHHVDHGVRWLTLFNH